MADKANLWVHHEGASEKDIRDAWAGIRNQVYNCAQESAEPYKPSGKPNNREDENQRTRTEYRALDITASKRTLCEADASNQMNEVDLAVKKLSDGIDHKDVKQLNQGVNAILLAQDGSGEVQNYSRDLAVAVLREKGINANWNPGYEGRDLFISMRTGGSIKTLDLTGESEYGTGPVLIETAIADKGVSVTKKFATDADLLKLLEK